MTTDTTASHSFNDKFFERASQADALCRDAADSLWRLVRVSSAQHLVALDAPPWLQGMMVTAEAASQTRDGKRTIHVTVSVKPSRSNPAFEPVAATVRSPDVEEEFLNIVHRALYAMLVAADQRIPAQTLADMIWMAGLNNPSHRCYPKFRQDFAGKCLELGTRPQFAGMSPEAARTLIEWLKEWTAANAVNVPDVSWHKAWARAVSVDVVDEDPFAIETPHVTVESDPFAVSASSLN
jgi:hypothetical protein